MAAESNESELWLMKIAREYDGNLPYHGEIEVIEWLRQRAEETEDKEERKRYRELIEEAEDYGGADDWGQISGALVKFARLLELINARLQA
ncbi:hypothetical protein ACFLYN_06790 [Chloroflexota bacterium]